MVVGDVTTAVNTVVVGGGPGGYVTAIRAAQLGIPVTLVNQGALGGVCLNSGCIPLKSLVTAARRYRTLREDTNKGMGFEVGNVTLNYVQLQAWKQSVVDWLSGGVKKLLSAHKIEVVPGLGWFINANELRVEGEYGSHRFSFDKAVIATGSRDVHLQGLPFSEGVLSPSQALALTSLPESFTIIGSDYIALEMATLFHTLGALVTLLVPAEQPLPDVEPSAVRAVMMGFRKQGITVATGVSQFRLESGKLRYVVTERGQSVERFAGLPVIAGGYQPNLDKLQLDATGLKLAGGLLDINGSMQTSLPHLYAVGDSAGMLPLASLAIKQAKVAAEGLAGKKAVFAPLSVPQVAHTTPEIAWVGLNAEQAKTAGYKVVTGRFPLAANGRALTLGSEHGVAFTIAEQGSGVLLGMTLVAPNAGDLIMEASLGIEMGATLLDLSEILHPHPGLPELILESAESALGLPIHAWSS